MSFIFKILKGYAQRHARSVDKRYGEIRNIRNLDFYEGAIKQSEEFDPEEKLFNLGFYDDVAAQMRETENRASSQLLYFILISILLASLLVGANLSFIFSGLRLENVRNVSDFLLIGGGYTLYMFILSMCKASSLESILRTYVQRSIRGDKKITFPQLEALWLSKYGYNFLDYTQNLIIIKGKYVYPPYKIRRVLKAIIGYSMDILFAAAVIFYIFNTRDLLTDPPVNIIVSAVACSIFWLFAAMAALEFIALFSVETGLLAKGRKVRPGEGDDRVEKEESELGKF